MNWWRKYPLFALLLLFTACGVRKFLPEEQSVVNSYKLRIDLEGSEKKEEGIYADEIISYLRPPVSDRRKDIKRHYKNIRFEEKGRKKRYKNIDPPSIYDTADVVKNKKRIESFFFSKGYFDVVASPSVETKKGKSDIRFEVSPGKQFKIGGIETVSRDSAISQIVAKLQRKSYIHKGDGYSADKLSDERDRLYAGIRDEGYYQFARDYIRFVVDTMGDDRYKIHLKMVIESPKELLSGTDSVVILTHQRFKIGDIQIIENGGKSVSYDQNGVEILRSDEVTIRNEMLVEKLSFRKGMYYNLSTERTTYRRLGQLGVYKFISIDYVPIGEELLVKIQLEKSQKQSFQVETMAANQGGNLGLQGSFSYTNKNLNKGAQHLTFSLSGGIESQQTFVKNKDKTARGLNTYEIRPEVKLQLPGKKIKLVDRLLPAENPSLSYSASYLFQKRPGFRMEVAKGEVFMEDRRPGKWFSSYYFSPFELAYSRIDTTNAASGILFQSQLRNYFNTNLHYRMEVGKKLDGTNRRESNLLELSFESSGMLFSLAPDKWYSIEEGIRKISGVPYSHYLKTSIDWRYYQRIVNQHILVYRFEAGVGIPFDNSHKSLPFDRGYTAGGAKSMRAFGARTMGPGLYFNRSDTVTTQIGDIKFETNLEYRFPVARILGNTTMLHLAAFVDVGNIWLYPKPQGFNYSESFQRIALEERGEFDFGKFYKELGVGGGIGFRFDVDYFVLRIDMAYPLRYPNPAQEIFLDQAGVKWYQRATWFNFAFDYPF